MISSDSTVKCKAQNVAFFLQLAALQVMLWLTTYFAHRSDLKLESVIFKCELHSSVFRPIENKLSIGMVISVIFHTNLQDFLMHFFDRGIDQ